MQSIDLMAELTDRVRRTMEATDDRFTRHPSENRVMWTHSEIPNMVLCVEQDGDELDVLLVGEESDPDNLYPFDDVCACWAQDWGGTVKADDGPEVVETNQLPCMIKKRVDDSIEYAKGPSEPQEDDAPLGPVLSLAQSLALVNEHADKIERLFSAEEIVGTRDELRKWRQQIYTKMGLDFGNAWER